MNLYCQVKIQKQKKNSLNYYHTLLEFQANASVKHELSEQFEFFGVCLKKLSFGHLKDLSFPSLSKTYPIKSKLLSDKLEKNTHVFYQFVFFIEPD